MITSKAKFIRPFGTEDDYATSDRYTSLVGFDDNKYKRGGERSRKIFRDEDEYIAGSRIIADGTGHKECVICCFCIVCGDCDIFGCGKEKQKFRNL